MSDRRKNGRRKEDRKLNRVRIAREVWRDAVPAIAIGLAAWALWIQQGTVNDLDREAQERTDGQCTIFEGQHLDDVTALSNTYAYFLTITPEDTNDAIFKFAVRQLPATEARAYKDRAPDYCDAQVDGHDVGLPEPDPKIPPRPKGLTQRLRLPPLPKH